MNNTTLRLLGVVVALLVIGLIFIESTDDGLPGESGSTLLPDLRARLDDVELLRIERFGEDPVEIVRREDRWVVSTRDDFAADFGKVREVLLAMADAATVEAKTANPDLHSRLGLELPDAENSKGTLVTAAAGQDEYRLLFGNVAQTRYRYARLPDEDQAWLVDQNPDIPTDAGDWLDPDIVDIDASAVRAVSINHPDGEVINIEKESEDASDFTVKDIPAGRELSYSTVANGIGGALNALELDDVRPDAGSDGAVTTSFETFDGMTMVVTTVKTENGSWITLSATGAGADELNARLSGWQFRIADYKANLLTRRWEEILKSETEAGPDE